MGRIIIDLPDEDIRQLDSLKEIRAIPRAEIIRQAIDGYLKQNKITDNTRAFGLWSDTDITDGVVYQKNLRKEWQ